MQVKLHPVAGFRQLGRSLLSNLHRVLCFISLLTLCGEGCSVLCSLGVGVYPTVCNLCVCVLVSGWMLASCRKFMEDRH